MKALCHNICVLANAMYTLGVVPSFDGRLSRESGS